MSVLVSVVAFLLAISILVSFHEFGHYWVARRCGVRVLRFSVGFGRPLYSYTSKNSHTQWVIARWPLGGYVKMLDRRELEEELPEESKPYEFTGKPLYQRAAIIAAGPVFNFILAFLLYSLVFLIGESGLRPMVGHVYENSPAAEAGMAIGDEVLSVNGQPLRSWSDFVVPLLDGSLNEGRITLQVQTAQAGVHEAQIAVGPDLLDQEDLLATLGFEPMRATSTAVIGGVQEGSAAATAKLEPGDRVLRLDDQPIDSWRGLVEATRARGGQRVWLEFARDGTPRGTEVHIGSIEEAGALIGKLGVSPYVDSALNERLRVTVRHSLTDSLRMGAQRTWELTVLTLRVLGELISGGMSTRMISGPVGIAEFAGVSAMAGVTSFLSMMALLSLSLGILNLLPVPILDGGHLVGCAIEWVTGKPLSESFEAVAQRIGMILLATLMLLALYNDLLRLLG